MDTYIYMYFEMKVSISRWNVVEIFISRRNYQLNMNMSIRYHLYLFRCECEEIEQTILHL